MFSRLQSSPGCPLGYNASRTVIYPMGPQDGAYGRIIPNLHRCKLGHTPRAGSYVNV